jgi:hypothetical protein
MSRASFLPSPIIRPGSPVPSRTETSRRCQALSNATPLPEVSGRSPAWGNITVRHQERRLRGWPSVRNPRIGKTDQVIPHQVVLGVLYQFPQLAPVFFLARMPEVQVIQAPIRGNLQVTWSVTPSLVPGRCSYPLPESQETLRL